VEFDSPTVTFGNAIKMGVRSATGASSTLSLKRLQIYPLGLLDSPLYQPALATDDAFGRSSRRLLGMSPVSTRTDVAVHGSLSWSGSHEGKSLLGGRAFFESFVPTLIALKPSAASSGSGWTVGTSASGARYKAAATYSTSKVIYIPSDFANRTPGGTGATNLDIVIDPDTANITTTIQATVRGVVTAGTP